MILVLCHPGSFCSTGMTPPRGRAESMLYAAAISAGRFQTQAGVLHLPAFITFVCVAPDSDDGFFFSPLVPHHLMLSASALHQTAMHPAKEASFSWLPF